MDEKVICMNCGRPFPIWYIHEKTVKCPFCSAKGDNPHYIKPEKIDPKSVFQKFDEVTK